MKLPLNPFKLSRLLRQHAILCSKQCLALIDANDHIAKLVTENFLQQKRIKFLETELEISQNSLKAEQMLREMVQRR